MSSTFFMRRWLLAAVLLPATVFGQATTDSGLTVLPWDGVFLQVLEKEKRLSLSFSDSFGSVQYKLDASAPLDGKTRRASFVAENQLMSGFKASAFFAYDSNLAILGAMASRAKSYYTSRCRDFLAKNPGKQCHGNDYEIWLQQNYDICKEFLERNPGRVCSNDDYEVWLRRTREDFEQSLIPARTRSGRSSFVLGGEAGFVFDRLTGLRGDLASSPEDFSQLAVSAGVRGTLYYAPFLATTVRGGYEYKDDVSGATVERCVVLPSADPAVSGRTCEDTLFVNSDSKPSHSAYVEAAATLVIPKEVSGSTPGLEARVRLVGIGGTKKLLLSPTFFFSPTRQPVVAKFGVGFDAIRALDADPGGQFQAGRWWFIPFAVVGADL